ncbi:GNAT family N-acetyltransferase [Nocardioides aestuarii]|uniref:GNAT family N-acetyltransferase n=1 Tax=Nocardioides aestuarii TaxID=252231 RepID=A0ABW4TQB6_9ACTN
MELREVDPTDTALVSEYVAVRNAADTVDSPWTHPSTVRGTALDLVHGWDGEPDRAFLLDAGGVTVGTASLGASSWDNRELAWVGVRVHPGHRRRGHGTAAFALLHDECRRIGRPLVGTDHWDAPGPRAFAATIGYEARARSVNRRQHLADLPAGLFEEAYAEAASHADDYELVRIAGRSDDATRERLVAVAESINDAPMDDLEVEDEVYPVERLAAFEDAQIGSGHRLYRVVARHRSTGELAGHTVMTVEEERPWIGVQEDTSVVAAHRGHRLGLLLKADLGRWLGEAEPDLLTVDTWNAASNPHMIGVNERLGYRVVGEAVELQQRLT